LAVESGFLEPERVPGVAPCLFREGKTWFLKKCPVVSVRMMIETVLSMLTLVCHFKKVMHRAWEYFKSRVGYTMALFNLLVQWHGLEPDETGMVHLHIAEFSL
jgi:hypothetical protein